MKVGDKVVTPAGTGFIIGFSDPFFVEVVFTPPVRMSEIVVKVDGRERGEAGQPAAFGFPPEKVWVVS